MPMVNLKMSREERKEYAEVTADPNEPQYPYGLCIDLDDDTLEKLGITTMPAVGTAVQFTARAVVKSTSSNQYDGNEPESRMTLQITDMEVGDASRSATDSATALYGE